MTANILGSLQIIMAYSQNWLEWLQYIGYPLVAFLLCSFLIYWYTMLNDTGQNLTTGEEFSFTSTQPTSTLMVNLTDDDDGNMTNISSPQIHVTMEEEIRDFYIGLFLAISSSLFIGTSFILKKLGLLRLAKNQSTRAGQGGYGYLKEWMWWGGMSMMITGEFANFAAYAFAPATMVTPLGALSVLVSAVLSSRFLKEKLNLLGKIGCALCILGSTVMVLHSPREQEVESMEQLLEKIKEPVFIIFAILMVATAVVFIIFLVPRYGHKTILVYITICSTLGSFTVMGCKGVGVAMKETFRGHNEFANWLTWVLLIVVIACILVQMNYLNRALDTYNTAVVTPIYYVFFTSTVILMSAILYKEWKTMSGIDITGDMCGFLTIVTGIFLLQAFKDINVSLKNLPKMKKEDQSSLNGDVLTSPMDDELGLLENDSVENSLQIETEYRDDYDNPESFTEGFRP